MNSSNPDKLVGQMWLGVYGYGRSTPGVACSAVRLRREQEGQEINWEICMQKVHDKSVLKG